MGEVADRVAEFVTAYSGDLKDESLDGQRLVVCGIVVASRVVVTRTRSTMAVVTLEDVQGSLEIVVFPRLWEQTGPIWQDGSILLVAGRVDHRGEEVSLLADVVVAWDEAVVTGPAAFAREVANGDRGPARRRQPVAVGPGGAAASGSNGGNGSSNGANGNGHAAVAPPARVPAGAVVEALGRRPDIPYVSPLRGGVMPEAGPLELPGTSAAAAALPRIAPAEPLASHVEPPNGSELVDHDVEPALPDEARSRVASEAARDTVPQEVGDPGGVLHVRFGGAPATRLVLAMETFRQLARERPGETRVVVHVPEPGGTALPMELRAGVAYDAELVAEIRRRLGEGVVQLSVAPPG
jgi:hypothetical protein